MVALAQEELKSKVAYRAYREKQRARIQDLVARLAIDAKLADEQEDQYQAAFAGPELAASRSRSTRGQGRRKYGPPRPRAFRPGPGRFRVRQGRRSQRPRHGSRSRRYSSATRSSGPRTPAWLPSETFIPANSSGLPTRAGTVCSLLAVESGRTMMRVVIQVPERDVPFVENGTPATVELDALPGIVFKTRGTDKVEVSRFAASEDPNIRMMRTEVHLKNPDGKLRRGMFGRITLVLALKPGAAVLVPDSLRRSGWKSRGRQRNGPCGSQRQGLLHRGSVRNRQRVGGRGAFWPDVGGSSHRLHRPRGP